MLFTSEIFNKASGKLGPLVADCHSPAPVTPPSLPVSFNSFRLKRQPAAQTSFCRFHSPFLLRAAHVAWRSLTDDQRLFWLRSCTYLWFFDRFGDPCNITPFNAFCRCFFLSSTFNLSSFFGSLDSAYVYDDHFFRLRSIACTLHYSGHYLYTFHGFIPDYFGALLSPAYALFSRAVVPLPFGVRYRGSYPFRYPIGVAGLSGRDCQFVYVSPELRGPYSLTRTFFKFQIVYSFPFEEPEGTFMVFSFTVPVISYVDFLGL